MKYGSLAMKAFGLVLLLSLLACGGKEMAVELPPVLQAAELNDAQQSYSNLVLVEVSKPEQFEAAHVAGAQNIWRPDFTDTTHELGGMTAPRKQIETLLRRLGVEQDDYLVVYDNVGNVNSAKFCWILYRYGFKQTSLLDGGTDAWRLADLPIERGDAGIGPESGFVLGEAEDLSRVATKEDVQEMIRTQGGVLIDARSEDEFSGLLQKKGAARAGRIPGAIRIDYHQNILLDKENRFRTIDELKALYEGLGVQPEIPVITYCQSGARSALTTFVLKEVLHYADVRNYDGSWIEWSADSTLSIEQDSIPGV